VSALEKTFINLYQEVFHEEYDLNVKGVLILAMIITLEGTLTLVFNIPSAKAKTIIVPDNYSTIQQAVDAAVDGDVIQVRAGTYTENIMISEKSISLIGIDGARNTIIRGVYASG